MEVLGYVLDIAEVLIIMWLVFWVGRLQKRIKDLENKG